MGLKEKKGPITYTQLVKYAGASGDFNPLHTVTSFAQDVGFQDVIAHGMLVMGFGGQAISTWFPESKIKHYKVRFQNPTLVHETLVIKGEIVEETSSEKSGLIVIQNDQGEVKVSGSFKVQTN